MKNIIQLSKTVLTLIVLYAGSPVTTTLFAQEEKQSEEVTPIPSTEILSKSEETSGFLSEILAEVDDTGKYNALVSDLPDFKKRIAELKKDPLMQNLIESSETKIKDLRQKWLGYKSEINDAISQIEVFSKSLEEKRQDLVHLKEAWNITASNAASQELPQQLRNRARTVVKEIATVESKLSAEIDDRIKLQNRFLDHISEIDKILAQIERVLAKQEEDYWAIDAEPLWSIFQQAGQFDDFVSSLFHTHGDNWQTLLKFYDNYRGRVFIHILCFIAIAGGLISIRKFRNTIMIDKDFSEWSQNVLQHPYAVAMLVTLLLMGAFYPLAPNIIVKLAQMIALVAVVRLLPTRHSSRIKKNAILFSGLYYLDILYIISADQTLFSRLALAMITALSIVYLYVSLQLSIFSTSENRLIVFGKKLTKLLIGILIVALISNILGNASLAVLITSASLKTIFLLFILFISSNVVVSLIYLLLHSKLANKIRIISEHGRRVKKTIFRFIYFLASLIFVINALNSFKVFYPLYNWLSDLVSFRLQIGSVDISTGDILVFCFAIYVSVYVSKFIQFVLREDVFNRMQLARGIPTTISLLTKYLIVGLGFMIALSAAGFDLTKFAIIFGALGVGIGFGLQNIVNNFISGLILIFERPIQAGDTVAIGDLLGTVTHIGIRASTVRTFDGSEVIVPNGHLIENQVINWTLSDRRRRIEVKIGAAYGTDPEFVLKVLGETVSDIPGVLKEPEPLILFQEFGDSSLNFSVRFWTEHFETWLQLQSDAAVAINNAFKEAGIVIPFPQRDLHLNTVDTKIIRDIKDNQDDNNL